MDETRFEKWRPTKGYPKYEISNFGRIRSFHRGWNGRILSPATHKAGYQQICLTREDGKQRTVKIHRLVAVAFLGDSSPERDQVNHKNGVKDDNRVGNLEWVGGRDNVRHAVQTGLTARKMSDEQVVEIREKAAKGGVTYAELAEEFGIHHICIGLIVRGVSYPHLGGPIKVPKRGLSSTDVVTIRERADQGEKYADIASDYGVTLTCISNIARGVSRKNDGGPIQKPRLVRREIGRT